MLIICSTIAKNRLAHVRVLMESVARFHPEAERVVLLVDEVEGCFDPADEPFELVLARELDIPGWLSLAMRCDEHDLGLVTRPFFLQYLFATRPADKIICLDSDVLITAPLEPLLAQLDQSMALLTPNILAPFNDSSRLLERDQLRSGAFNSGFFAIARRGRWSELLRWWGSRLSAMATLSEQDGRFTPQRWMDAVPALFEEIGIVRHPGANIGWWNIHERGLTQDEGGYRVNGESALFFNFSGLPVKDPEIWAPNQNRPGFGDLGNAWDSVQLAYGQYLKDHNYGQIRSFPYVYGRYSDGAPISDIDRACLRLHDPEGTRWLNPFEITSPNSFRAWCCKVSPSDSGKTNVLSPYALALHWFRLERQGFDLLAAVGDDVPYARSFVSQEYASPEYAPIYTRPVAAALERLLETESSALPRSERFWQALEYYRYFPTRIAPSLPPQVLNPRSSPSVTSLRGAIRSLRAAARRLIGLRLILAWHHYRSLSPPPQPNVTPKPEPLPASVNVIGYASSIKGIGEAMRSTLRSLEATGTPYTALPIQIDGLRDWRIDRSSLLSVNGDGLNIFHVNADGTFAIRSFLREDVRFTGFNIGFWFWELETFPAHWAYHFSAYDEIWVASAFIEQVLRSVSPIPVTRIPLAIDVGSPPAVSRAELNLPERAFLFLFMFDMDSVVERKNPWAVIEAFRRAFSEAERSEEYRLVLKVVHLDPESRVGRQLVEAAASVDAILINQALSREATLALIHACDAYVSLHRSEGFGLTIAEAMALGKPVIATAYSGNMEFMTPETSYPVPYQRVPIAKYAPPYPIGAVWAEPDIDAAAILMRQVVSQPEEAKERGRRAAAHIRQHFSPGVIGQQMARRIAEIRAARVNSASTG